MAAGDPIGDDLCSGTTDGDTLPDFTASYEEREITIDTPVELTNGVKYAIVVKATAGDLMWVQKDDVHADGIALYSNDSGSSWTEDGTWDMWFKTKADAVEKDTNTFAETGWPGYDIDDTNWDAQSFTASSTYTISSIVLKLAKFPATTPGTATVSIKVVSAVGSKATTPAPANAADDVTLDQATLTWEDGGDSDSFDVYYGDTSGDLELVSSAQADLSYTVTGVTLGSPYNYLVTRYWRIDSTNDAGTVEGDEWSFTTISFDCLRISYVLIDGGSGAGPYDTPPGVEGTDWRYTGENNLMTVRKLVAAANNKFWYEEL